jgi:hypothetical protein
MSVRVRRIVVEGALLAVAVLLVVWALRADADWWAAHWYRHYCAVERWTVTAAVVARVAAAMLALLLALTRRRIGAFLAERSLRRALPVLLAIVAALATTEGVLRWREARRPRRIAHGFLRHRGRQALLVEAGGRKVWHYLNRDGMRARSMDDVPDTNAPTIVISGESVALGLGLDYDETVGARLTTSTGIQTANLAVSGEGNDHALLRLRKYLPQLAKPVAVVSFVITTWLERNVDNSRDYLGVDADGHLVWRVTPEIVRTSPLRALLVSIVRYRGDEPVEIARALLRETAALARSSGALPVFVVTQCGPHCIDPDPWIARRIVEGLDAKVVRVETNDVTIPNDMHPNAEGARRYADAIERVLREANVVP